MFSTVYYVGVGRPAQSQDFGPNGNGNAWICHPEKESGKLRTKAQRAPRHAHRARDSATLPALVRQASVPLIEWAGRVPHGDGTHTIDETREVRHHATQSFFFFLLLHRSVAALLAHRKNHSRFDFLFSRFRVREWRSPSASDPHEETRRARFSFRASKARSLLRGDSLSPFCRYKSSFVFVFIPRVHQGRLGERDRSVGFRGISLLLSRGLFGERHHRTSRVRLVRASSAAGRRGLWSSGRPRRRYLSRVPHS